MLAVRSIDGDPRGTEDSPIRRDLCLRDDPLQFQNKIHLINTMETLHISELQRIADALPQRDAITFASISKRFLQISPRRIRASVDASSMVSFLQWLRSHPIESLDARIDVVSWSALAPTILPDGYFIRSLTLSPLYAHQLSLDISMDIWTPSCESLSLNFIDTSSTLPPRSWTSGMENDFASTELSTLVLFNQHLTPRPFPFQSPTVSTLLTPARNTAFSIPPGLCDAISRFDEISTLVCYGGFIGVPIDAFHKVLFHESTVSTDDLTLFASSPKCAFFGAAMCNVRASSTPLAIVSGDRIVDLTPDLLIALLSPASSCTVHVRLSNGPAPVVTQTRFPDVTRLFIVGWVLVADLTDWYDTLIQMFPNAVVDMKELRMVAA